MAVNKAKRPAKSKQPALPKFPIYQALFNFNTAFQTIGNEIETLRASGLFPPETLKLYAMTGEELRSGINHKILQVMELRESRDWGHIGQQKLKQEKRLKLHS